MDDQVNNMRLPEFVEYLKTIQTIKDLPDGTKQAEPSEWALAAADYLKNLAERMQRADAQGRAAEEECRKWSQMFATLTKDSVYQACRDQAISDQKRVQVVEQHLAEALGRIATLQAVANEFQEWVHDLKGVGRRQGRSVRNRKLAARVKRVQEAFTETLPEWATRKIDSHVREFNWEVRRNLERAGGFR